MITGPTIPNAPCPVCSGPRLYSIVFQHVDGCSLRTALDSTEANDCYGSRKRAATAAEITLCNALGANLSGGVLTKIISRPPIWLRQFIDSNVTFDPDMITEVTP